MVVSLMARHADGRANFRVAAGPIIALIVVAVLVAAISAWLGVRRSAQQEHHTAVGCVDGTITVPVFAEARDNVVDQLLRAFNASHAVQGDHCVAAARTSSVSKAAIFISPDPGEDVIDYLSRKGRTPASAAWPVAFWESVVLSTTTPVSFSSWASAGEMAVVSPSEPPMIRATAAVALAGGDVDRAIEVARRMGDEASPVAQGESAVAPGSAAELFDDVAVPFRAVSLTTAPELTESQIRAAKTVEDFFRANIDQVGNEASQAVAPAAARVFDRLYGGEVGGAEVSHAAAPSSVTPQVSPSEPIRVDIATNQGPSQAPSSQPDTAP